MDLNYVTTLARIEFTSSGAWKSSGEVESLTQAVVIYTTYASQMQN